MPTLKVTSWNIEHMDRLFEEPSSETARRHRDARMEAVVQEVRDLDADVLAVLEGPRSESRITDFCTNQLGGDWLPILAADGDYDIRGTQGIWFLVKDALAASCALQSPTTWKAFTGASWDVNYWGDFDTTQHRHYRHPQVLVLDLNGQRVEFIAAHLKSKFVRAGESDWNAGGERRQDFIRDAIKARIKLTTEASNIRAYIDAKFDQVANPAIFLMGDLNDGPGKEYFEQQFLFFDLLSVLQGDVFFAERFLNHALFDFANHLRWSVEFEDFIDPSRNPHILLDHILFTQGLVDDSLPLVVESGAGLVEHEVHELIKATRFKYAHPNDHAPVSVVAEY
ncbi:MAG: endonuclease/exonuclease/phosphatase family protein [Acidobacteria bacterium]|nr:endonuclease/exonuclease/phosphatase family protein [Acidobacteriota bacterium]